MFNSYYVGMMEMCTLKFELPICNCKLISNAFLHIYFPDSWYLFSLL